MNSFICRLCMAIALLSTVKPASAQKRKDYTPLVDPFIGTAGKGNTFPGAVLPYGLVQINPETRLNGGGYGYTDEFVYGFSHTRFIVNDTAAVNTIIFMPTTGQPTFKPEAYRSAYTKKNEKASPGYFKTKLDKYEIAVELAATQRAGMQVYKYPSGSKANVLIDLQQGGEADNAYIEVISNHEVQGFRKATINGISKQVYFYSKFSKAFQTHGITLNDVAQTGKSKAEGKNIKMFVQFDSPGEVVIKTGLSQVSTAGALKNLDAEMPGFDINKVIKAGKANWNAELSKIYVEGGAPPLPPVETRSISPSNPYTHSRNKAPSLPDLAQMKLVTFYTALYHTMLTPNVAGDVDGQYRDSEGNTGNASNYTYYDVADLYNKFGQHYQFFTLIDSARTVDIIKSYISSPTQDSSANLAAFAADAYTKGIKGFDALQVYNTLKNQIENNADIKEFAAHGYVNGTRYGSVAKTLIYSYNFFCMAQFARMLNIPADEATYLQYAQYWKNLYNSKTGFIQPRQNGGFNNSFDPAEDNAAYLNDKGWVYTFLVPHDAENLAAYLGGKDALELKLDGFLVGDKTSTDAKKSVGYYTGKGLNGTIPYLYNYTGAPHKGQLYINRIIRRFYQALPEGLMENDVNGEVSAWYVLSSLGLYTIIPGQTQLHIGFPQFEKIIIKLPNNKTFSINNTGAAITLNNTYIQGMNLNKTSYNKLFLNYADIIKGGVFEVFTGTMPNKLFMQDLEKLSLKVTGNLVIPKPYIAFNKQLAELGCAEAETALYYTVDGSTPTTASKQYSKPFAVTMGTTVKVIAVKNNISSMPEEATFKTP